jgi:hypothetical protein
VATLRCNLFSNVPARIADKHRKQQGETKCFTISFSPPASSPPSSSPPLRSAANRINREIEMDDFTRQYLATALWSSTDESREDGGDPMDDNYSVEDLSAETVEWAIADCDRFREASGEMLDERPDPTAGAHDFWLTRNGHGAGFWDGDWPVNGDKLTNVCKGFGEAALYIGDDGEIYHYDG